MPFWHWLVLAAALAVIEIAVPAMVCIWLAAAARGTAFIARLAPVAAWEYQVLIFAALAVASVVIGRLVFARIPDQSNKVHLNRRAEIYLGRTFTPSSGRSSMAAGGFDSMIRCGSSKGSTSRPGRAYR